jgi:DNA-binding beta-propeller fold protein YncE
VIFVVDTVNDRVQVLETGSFFGSFGQFGEGNGQFLRPVGMAVNADTGDIYVSDADLHRVQKFDNTNAFQATTGSFGSGERSFNAPLS